MAESNRHSPSAVDECTATCPCGKEPDTPSRILVIDTAAPYRETLHQALVGRGYETTIASDLAQASPCLRQLPFDLIVMDIAALDEAGYETFEAARATSKSCHAPLIVIVPHERIDNASRALEAGVDDFLVVPFSQAVAEARIRACLEKKRLREADAQLLKQLRRERLRYDVLLRAVFPPGAAEELKETQAVQPRRYEDVAVLFADIVDFTDYCSARGPDEILNHLQEMVAVCEVLSAKHGLQKIKTVGDCFMATAGAPLPIDRPVERCVRAGNEMIAMVGALEAHWQLRVGVHIGSVIAGVVGHRQYGFDLWGDTVNTAARVESNGMPGRVNLSPEAWRTVSHLFNADSSGYVHVKGKGYMEIFSLVGG